MNVEQPEVTAPAPPPARLCVGVTGHREDHASFGAQRDGIIRAVGEALELIDAAVNQWRTKGVTVATTRLYSLLADGTDQLAAGGALKRGWEVVAPLPFGMALNTAINAHPGTVDDARALLDGIAGVSRVKDAEVAARAQRLYELGQSARRFELAERDGLISRLYLEKLLRGEDSRSDATFTAESSLRVALAARVMIEQTDLLIAVWDGTTRALVGGTGHTIQMALETGAPVIWIDARQPDAWRVLQGPESLVGAGDASLSRAERVTAVDRLTSRALQSSARPDPEMLARETWPVRSRWPYHAYRRIEALFGAEKERGRFRHLTQVYERPDAVVEGSAAALLARARALPGQELPFVDRIESAVLRRFAWADGVSAFLSDIYRGGMTLSFLFASLAIIGGIAYLPFTDSHHKWMFASFELLLLVGILGFTLVGNRRRWHRRWFETRRLAEYLRHAPILLLLGVTRPPGRWPQGTDTSWPETFGRDALREAGLPQLVVTQPFLRAATQGLLLEHVRTQREYHAAKAHRLAAVHHNLDHASQTLFAMAIISVATYLICKAGGALGIWSTALAEWSSYLFTFLGVLLPTLGGSLAGIRYFGDFERFAAISRVTAGKLQSVEARIDQLLSAPEGAMDYGGVADLAHATDDVVVTEIESWQAVFAGKNVSVPV